MLSNLIQPDFHLQPLLLETVWYGVLKTNALYPFSPQLLKLTNKCRAQSTAWEEDSIFEDHTFPSVSQLAGESGQWLCPSACPLGLVSNAGYRCGIVTTAKSFLTYHDLKNLKWFRNDSIWVLHPIINRWEPVHWRRDQLRIHHTKLCMGKSSPVRHLPGCLWGSARD